MKLYKNGVTYQTEKIIKPHVALDMINILLSVADEVDNSELAENTKYYWQHQTWISIFDAV